MEEIGHVLSEDKETDRLELDDKTKQAFDLGLIKIERQVYYRCVYENDMDYGTLYSKEQECNEIFYVNHIPNGQKFLYCSRNERRIRISDKIQLFKYYISNINENKLIKFLDDIMSEVTNAIVHSSSTTVGWAVEFPDKTINIRFSDIFFDPGLLFDLSLQNTVLITWKTNILNEILPYSYSEILFDNILEDPSILIETLRNHESTEDFTENLQNIFQNLRKRIPRTEMSDTEAELWIKELIDYCQRPETKRVYLQKLQLMKSYWKRSIQLGGPGKIDVIVFDLHDYFYPLFNLTSASIEVKHTLATQVTIDHLGAMEMRKQRNKQEAGFLFGFTNDIQDQLWEYIQELEGKNTLRVFDLHMIGFLIWATDAYHMLVIPDGK